MKFVKFFSTANGFTMIELLVATTVMAVMTALAVVSYTKVNVRSRDAKRNSDIQQLRSALEMYRADNGFYPAVNGSNYDKLDGLGNILVSTYLPKIPSDPKSTSNPSSDYYYVATNQSANANYYGYCICAKLEGLANTDDTCGSVSLPSTCNYAVKNP